MAQAPPPLDDASAHRAAPSPALSRRAFSALALAALAGCAGCDASPPPPDRLPDPLAPPSPPPPPSPAPAPSAASPAPPPIPPIFRAYPGLAARVPRLPLALLPTPIEAAPRLGRRAGVGALHIKRDDLSGELHGGGKTRKLEMLLAEAREAGARSVITFGGAGSNHAVATALYAARAGLRATLLLAPQPASDHLRENLLAMLRAGAEIRLVVGGVAQAEAEARRIVARSAPGEAPHIIAPGGTSPLGNLAFINAALELAEQVAAGAMPAPDLLYVAMGTMGCAVGLGLGLKLAGLKTQVVAVRASSAETSSERRLLAMAEATAAYARGLDPSFPALRLERGEVRVEGGYLGGGYARPTPAGERAIALAREEEGWALEPTYTGKALAALLGNAQVLSDKVVLFWNTHNSRPLGVEGVDPRGLPAGLRTYFAGLGEVSAGGKM